MSSQARTVPFEPCHIPLVGDYLPPGVALEYAKAGPCETLFVGTTVAACWGVYKQSEYTGTAWMLVNDDVRHKHARAILKAARRFLDICEISHSIHRIQITVKLSTAPFVRWSELLGFRVEGLMRKYDDAGEDHFLMARIKNG